MEASKPSGVVGIVEPELIWDRRIFRAEGWMVTVPATDRIKDDLVSRVVERLDYWPSEWWGLRGRCGLTDRRHVCRVVIAHATPPRVGASYRPAESVAGV